MRRKSKFNSINVVPFIDVMLVLLVIVLISASFVKTGAIKTKLPNGSNIDSSKKEVKLTIKKDGSLLLNNQAVSKDGLIQKIKGLNKSSPIFIYGSKDLEYNLFVQTLDFLQLNGFTNIAIVTKK